MEQCLTIDTENYQQRAQPDWQGLLTIIMLVLAAALYTMQFVDFGGGSTADGVDDAYDPRIGEIHTLEGLEAEARRQMRGTGNTQRDLALALTKIVALHSIHGVARQTWKQNWIANALDMMESPYTSYAGLMVPEDLAKENVAFCSQASLLLQELFRRNGIPQATVRFNVGGPPPHSAVAGKPDGVWRFYDASYEPAQQGVPFALLKEPGKILELYSAPKFKMLGIDKQFDDLARRGKIAIIGIDGRGPVRGIAFQRLTKTLSLHGWFGPLLIAMLLLYRRAFKAQALRFA